jgi:hypothetical protein
MNASWAAWAAGAMARATVDRAAAAAICTTHGGNGGCDQNAILITSRLPHLPEGAGPRDEWIGGMREGAF